MNIIFGHTLPNNDGLCPPGRISHWYSELLYKQFLTPFHNGIFKIAQKANVPVVICGIKGADRMPDNFPLHGTDIYFEVLDVLTEEQIRTTRCNDIGDYARDLMLSFVERNQEEEQNVNLRTV